jgi:hypothetical protein
VPGVEDKGKLMHLQAEVEERAIRGKLKLPHLLLLFQLEEEQGGILSMNTKQVHCLT